MSDGSRYNNNGEGHSVHRIFHPDGSGQLIGEYNETLQQYWFIMPNGRIFQGVGRPESFSAGQLQDHRYQW